MRERETASGTRGESAAPKLKVHPRVKHFRGIRARAHRLIELTAAEAQQIESNTHTQLDERATLKTETDGEASE